MGKGRLFGGGDRLKIDLVNKIWFIFFVIFFGLGFMGFVEEVIMMLFWNNGDFIVFVVDVIICFFGLLGFLGFLLVVCFLV